MPRFKADSSAVEEWRVHIYVYCLGSREERYQYPEQRGARRWLELALEERSKLADQPTQEMAISETQGITKFDADRATDKTTKDFWTEIDGSLKASTRDKSESSIKEFLGRDVLVSNNAWAITDQQGTVIVAIEPITVLLSKPLWANKIDGFLGFRAKPVYRIEVNAQKFQQGLLRMSYFPQRPENLARDACAGFNIATVVQLPGMDFDLSHCTDCQLVTPFIGPMTYFDFTSSAGYPPTFALRVYSPLKSSAATSVQVLTWMHFEDVELVYPTKSQARYKSNGRGSVKLEEEKGASGGVVSSVLGTASKVATVLADVPVLSSIAGPAAWMLGIASNAASAMGFSKPIQTAMTCRTTLEQFAYSNNWNGVDTSQHLATICDSQVEALPGFAGSAVDEMDFKYIAKIPGYVGNFGWADTNVLNDTIASFVLSPSLFRKVENVATASGTISVQTLIPASYIANAFKKWRSGWNFTFKVVKTDFHTGRLEAYFFPGGGSSSLGPDDRAYLHREVFDIRDSNQFTFSVPYVSTKQFLENDVNVEDGGLVVLKVLAPLRMPQNVSSTVDIIVEVSANDEFAVAIPRLPTLKPVAVLPTGFVPTALMAGSVEEARPVLESQALGVLASETPTTGPDPDAPNIGSTVTNDVGLAPHKFCIGEWIRSIRQMVKITRFWFSRANNPACNITVRSADMVVPYIVTGSDPVSGEEDGMDWIDYFAPLFVLHRGGIRLKAFMGYNTAVDEIVQWSATLMPDHQQATFVDDVVITDIDKGQRVWTHNNIRRGIEVEVPQYAPYHSVLNRFNWRNDVTSFYEEKTVALCTDFETTGRFNVLRCAADDYELGGFVGVLPVSTLVIT